MHLASSGLDGQHKLEMPSNIEEPKLRNAMLDQNGLVFKHTEVATTCSVFFLIYVPLVFTIVANNGIMVIPSLPHGSTKTPLMRNYQSKNWGLRGSWCACVCGHLQSYEVLGTDHDMQLFFPM